MQLEVRNPLRIIMKIVDFINPYIVLISIIGLVLEYTGAAKFSPLLLFNQMVDLYFLVEFLFRLLAYKSAKTYFTKNYGWIDLLAAIPGFMVFLGGSSILTLVKITRIGKFFKIIRILRFLRMFSFMKKMKSDSKYIQDRLMKIGVSTVLIILVGIFLIDYFNLNNMTLLEKEKIYNYISIEGKERFLENINEFGIIAYHTGSTYKHIQENKVIDENEYKKLIDNEDYEELTVDNIVGIVFVIDVEDARNFHNVVMIIAILMLIVLLLLQLFYVGFILAKDVRVVQLIIDSLDADDFFLIGEEKRQTEEQYGTLEIKEGEDEFISLRKVFGKLSEKIEELDKRDNDLADMEYVMSIREDTSKNEQMEIQNAIEKTAETIYEKLKETKSIPSNSDTTSTDMGLDSDITSEISNMDNEILIKEASDKILKEIKKYLESEGITTISKKIIVDTINKLLPRIKSFLENKQV